MDNGDKSGHVIVAPELGQFWLQSNMVLCNCWIVGLHLISSNAAFICLCVYGCVCVKVCVCAYTCVCH